VKCPAAFTLILAAAQAAAAPAYVSDELVLGVYAEQNGQGQRLTTLHSGASVETLGVNGEFTEVRLRDGSTGWVKSSYLTTQEPAIVRVKALEEELDRSRATTPALAEAAARSEVAQLKHELESTRSLLDAARVPAAPAGAAAPGKLMTAGGRTEFNGPAAQQAWILLSAVLLALGCGFWLGYRTLAHRIKHKFGGIKVY
jgi:Bacterial SH3 domain